MKIAAASGVVSARTIACAASGALALVGDARGIDGDLLQFGRQHADHLDLRIVQQFRHLLQADLGLAARYQHADAAVRAAHGELGLGCDLVGDAELLEHPHDVSAGDAAAGRRGVADRLGGEQRALQRLGRRHVGLRRALAHRNADAGAAKVDAAARDLAQLDELVERRRIGQEDIDRLAALEARQQRAGRRIARSNGVAVGAFEGRQYFIGRGFDRGRDERIDLGGLSSASRSRKRDGEHECAHGKSFHHPGSRPLAR